MDTMAAPQPFEQVRISKIADRYLVFDAEHVAILRRQHHICSVLVGSTPQNPTQNVFMSLPLELLPEEAALLLQKKAATLADETSSHIDALRGGKAARQQYLELLKDRRRQAKLHIAEGQAQKAAQSREFAEKARSKKIASQRNTQSTAVETDHLWMGQESQTAIATHPVAESPIARSLTVTNTTSAGLGLQSSPSGEQSAVQNPVSPLHAHLLSQGYFMTPGLRFGAKYSVYPGDPLRYHAHFLATEYQWDEEIPMLDIVGSGRLGTSVKKGFLLGGEAAPVTTTAGPEAHVRAFCIEWAGM